MLALLIAGCAHVEGPAADSRLVACRLPGQIRQLGSQVTYVTASRLIRTTPTDCEIRGGAPLDPRATSAARD